VRWKDSILNRHIKPATERAGIGKVGWHTSPHLFEVARFFRNRHRGAAGTSAAPQHPDNYERLPPRLSLEETGGGIKGRSYVVRICTCGNDPAHCKLLILLVGGTRLERVTFCL